MTGVLNSNVYINFFQDSSYSSIFSGSLEVDHLVMMMSALLGSEAVFEAGKTIIVLDEIQECPEARTALKFFHLDGRFDVIGTGSLLGVRGYGKEPKSIPVGYETVLDIIRRNTMWSSASSWAIAMWAEMGRY